MKFEIGKVYSNPYATAFKSQKMIEGDADHEVKMAQGQLDYIINAANELKGKLGNAEKNIPGWIQDHISKAHSYLHQSNSGYHEYKKDTMSESKISQSQLKPIYDKLSKGDVVEITYDSSMSRGITKRFKVIKGKTIVGKLGVERITLVNVDKPTSVKYYLYNRNNNVTFAQGDMGASIVNMQKDPVNEGKLSFEDLKKGQVLLNKFRSGRKYTILDVNPKFATIKNLKTGNVMQIYSLNNYELKENSMKLSKLLNEQNTSFNKWLLKFVDDYVESKEFPKGSPEYQWVLATLLSLTLTDANFHKEAKKAKTVFRRAVEPDNSKNLETLLGMRASNIAKKAKWDGYDIIDGFAYVAAMRIGGTVMGNVTALKTEGVIKENTNQKNPKFKVGQVVNYIPKLSGLSPTKKLKINKVRFEKGDTLTKPGWYYSFDGMNLGSHENDIKLVETIKEATAKTFKFPKSITTSKFDEIDAELSRAGITTHPNFNTNTIKVSGDIKKAMKIISRYKGIAEVIKENTEPQIITQLRDVMKSGYKTLKDPKSGKKMKVDSYSASAIVQVYDAINQTNKDKFSQLGLLGMQSTAFKLIK
jgi:hypothetical protein